ncbi:MAG TPA: hypothetical protein VFG94_06770 [Acidimicrobiales bacterium]|jgi:hypothetical protein|nr:hypothetical protein [Acidimicrobiales bacterium]
MSPVARSQGHTGRALAVAAGGVVVAIGVAATLAVLANRGTVDVRLGSDTFAEHDAEDAARDIAENGPILYPDTAGGDRDIYLQHFGDDPEEGWIAFAARPPGVSRACTLQWDGNDEVFRLLDSSRKVSGECDGREFPADGEGLPTYPVTVDADGNIDVDLNAADRTTSTDG